MKRDRWKLWIVGYGNPHRCDDGIGLYTARRIDRLLPAGADVRVQSLPFLDATLASDLVDAEKVIFIDATAERVANGWDWKRITPQLGAWPLSLHDFSAQLILGLTKACFGRCPGAWMMSVQGEHFGVGQRLSRAATNRSEKMVEMILSFVKKRLMNTVNSLHDTQGAHHGEKCRHPHCGR